MDHRAKPSTPLATLANALNRIGRARDRNEIIDAVRRTSRSLIGCDGISLILRDGDFCHYVEEDAIGRLWKGQRFPISACISGWAMTSCETLIIPDIVADDRIPHELYGDTFVRALAMAPVRAEDPIAAIGAYWAQPYRPATWEVEILEALAEAVAGALANSDLIAKLSVTPTASVTDSNEKVDFSPDIARIAGIAAVPTILDVVLRMTGMGFAAVARVTDTKWVACQVLDPVNFGLTPGDELPLDSTLCNEIRCHRRTIVFDDATQDTQYRDHHTPRIYGLRSYISEPIILGDGSFWGTLCAIDPNPAKVKNPAVLGAFKIFAELIAHHLDSDLQLASTRENLKRERELAEVREQFIAVLGHDLRNPIAALNAGTNKLLREGWSERSPLVLELMRSSISRMSGLVESIMDLARARMGGGISLAITQENLADVLEHVVDEVRLAHPGRQIVARIDLPASMAVDHRRIAQMVSNLLSNAVTHGDAAMPIVVIAETSKDGLEISVKNGGKQIAPTLADKLFLPFQRGDDRSEVQGLGLGLHIASQIAQAHGGRIEMESDDIATCFAFKLPNGSSVAH